MNHLLHMLSGGTLQSDGGANQVADLVVAQPELFDLLLEGLSQSDDLIRGRAAHAVERVARSRPDLVHPHLAQMMHLARRDPLPMVRWHMAMIPPHLPLEEAQAGGVADALLEMLDDSSAFAASWAIVSLVLLGRRYPAERGRIAERMRPLLKSHSAAISRKALKAVWLLENVCASVPAGWIKCS